MVPILIIITIAGLSYLVYRSWLEITEKKVEKNSTRIKKLLSINKEMDFKGGINTHESYARTFPNKRTYDTFDLRGRW